MGKASRSKLKAIKAYCLQCVGEGGVKAVRECPFGPDLEEAVPGCGPCPLWPYRMGHNPWQLGQGPKSGRFAPKTPTKTALLQRTPVREALEHVLKVCGGKGARHRTFAQAIRAYCLWCCNGKSQEVSMCDNDECSLHPFRRQIRKRKDGTQSQPCLSSV